MKDSFLTLVNCFQITLESYQFLLLVHSARAALGTGYVLRSSRIDEPKMLISTSMDAELLED